MWLVDPRGDPGKVKSVKRAAILLYRAAMTAFNRVRIAAGADGSGAVAYWVAKDEDTELKDAQVDGYDSRHEELRPILEEMKQDLRCHVAPLLVPGAAILDFGCGTGRYYELFYGAPGVRVVGVDVSAPVLDNFARRKFPNGEFHAADLTEDDSFVRDNEGRFDAIYSVSVIQYVRFSRVVGLAKSFARLLRPSGLLYLSFPHPDSRWDEISDLGYIRYRPEVLEGYMDRAGFEVTGSYSVHHRRRVSGIDRSGLPNYGYTLVARKR